MKQKYKFEMYSQQYLIDQGWGCRLVQYKAWRTERPHVFGYGMTKDEAIHNLIHDVPPL